MAPTLYDAYGRPVQARDLKREIAEPTLTGVRSVWTDSMAAGLTPAKLATILVAATRGDGDAYLTLAEEMEERELHYLSVLGTRKRAVKRLPVVVEAASDGAGDVRLADAVRDLASGIGFRSLLEDLLDAFGKGFSVCEILWDTSERQWSPSGYKWRDPRFFSFDRVSLSSLRLRDESSPMDGLPPAPYKFIVHYPKLKTGIPLRGGLARPVAWAYLLKNYALKDWMAFAEVFGMPLRLGRYGPSASNGDIDILKMAVANLGSDAAAVLPDSMRIEFINGAAGTGGQDLYERLVNCLDKQISKAVLGQTMTADDGSSQSQAKVHNEVRGDIRDSDAEQLAEDTLSRDLVRPFIDLNFGPQKVYPKLMLQIAEREDIGALSDALSLLVPLGLKVEASVIRDRLGLPDPAEGAEVLGAPINPQMTQINADEGNPRPSADTGQSEGGTEPAPNRALNQTTVIPAQSLPPVKTEAGIQGEDGDAVDEMVADELGDWEPLLTPVLDPVRQAAEAAGSYEEFVQRLLELAQSNDPGKLVESLALALFKARAMGDAAGDAPEESGDN